MRGIRSATGKLFIAGVALASTLGNCEEKMNDHLQLYTWVRAGDTIAVAQIAKLEHRPGSPGEEIVTVDFEIDRKLWGPGAGLPLRYEASLPASEVARLKFPDPVWGRVTLRKGAVVLLVTTSSNGRASGPVYVEDIDSLQSETMVSVDSVLSEEKSAAGEKARVDVYLRWLANGRAPEKLFAAEALAKDKPPLADADGRVATSFALSFNADRDVYVRLNLETWMWEDIYPRTNRAGRINILNATIRGALDASEDIRRFSLDRIVEVDPEQIHQARVAPVGGVLQALEERLKRESSPEARAQVQKVIEALRR